MTFQDSKLISCPDCNIQVSKEAITCPNCGRPIKKEDFGTKMIKAGQNMQQLGMAITLAVIAIWLLIAWIF